jgi:Outer membrane protein beta-barrel domain
MTKVFFSLLLLLGNINIGKAQVHFAPSVGMNFSKLRNTDHTGGDIYTLISSPLTGYYIGGFFTRTRSFLPRLTLQAAIQYSQKGYGQQLPPNTAQSQFRFHYLDIMPSIEYQLGQTKRLGITMGINKGIDLFEQVKEPNQSDWKKIATRIMDITDLGFLVGLKLYHKNSFLRYPIMKALVSLPQSAIRITWAEEEGPKH